MSKRCFIAFTPGGSPCMETEAGTREKCIAKLLKATSHMPYGSWEAMEARGYEVCEMSVDNGGES